MKKATKIIVGCAVLLVLIAAFLLIWQKNKPATTQGSKGYTIAVVNDAGEEKLYTARTDAEYLRGAMDELAALGDFSYEGDESEYGLMITTINGVTADFNTDGAYWAIYVNDEYGNYGADQQPVSDGDAFKFVYEKA